MVDLYMVPLPSYEVGTRSRRSLRTTIRRLNRWEKILRDAEVARISGTAKVTFNMGMWYDESEEDGCGTAACAAGYACLDRGFRRRGLHIANLGTAGLKYPAFKGAGAEFAIAKFFGVAPSEARWLVYLSQYAVRGREAEMRHVTPAMVADRIAYLAQRYGDALKALETKKEEVSK